MRQCAGAARRLHNFGGRGVTAMWKQGRSEQVQHAHAPQRLSWNLRSGRVELGLALQTGYRTWFRCPVAESIPPPSLGCVGAPRKLRGNNDPTTA